MITLTVKQTAALDVLEDMNNGINEIIYGGSAGSGKSVVGCHWVLKNCFKFPGSRWLIGRSELKTLKQTTLVTFFEVCKMQNLIPGTHYQYKEQAGEIHFINGSIVILKDLKWNPSDPDFDSLGSLEISGAFVDEIAQIRKKAWDILKTRVRYKLDEFGIIGKIFGSLNPSKGWVFTYFYKPWREGKLSKNMYFERALPTDNKHLAQSYLDSLNNLPKPERDRLYLGLWEANDDNQLATQDNIHNVFSNSFVDTTGMYITIDVARQGKDKSIIIVWRGLKAFEIITIEKNSITELADKVKELHRKYVIPMSNVIADESGVGGGLVDILRCKGFVGGSKALNNENYFNLRTQCLYYLAKFVNDNNIWIDTKNETLITDIVQELEQIKSTESDGKLKVISKDEVKNNIGRSPDYSDTISMRMFFEINKNKGIYNFV